MDIERLIDEYFKWLKSEITCEQVGEYYEITTPFLDSANDYVQIYVKQVGKDVFFSDDCETMRNLDIQGFNMTSKRKMQLDSILRQYGVSLDGEELVAKAPINRFAQSKHMFIQAILKVNDLLFMTNTRTQSSFPDDVLEFFHKNEIYYTDGIQVLGKSGFPHRYDFVFHRSKTKHERFCSTINRPYKNSLETTLFAWADTSPRRGKDTQLIFILNDKNKISSSVIDGFLNYDVGVIPWSEREKPENIALLTA